jgi:hypothetical protein
LTVVSEYPTLGVVKTDIQSTAPPPPFAGPPATGPTVETILSGVAAQSVAQLHDDLTRLLRAAQPNRQLAETSDDGSPMIPSLVAVFLINQVGLAVGRPKLVDLSQVHREDLRSLGGIARLVYQSLHPISADPLAS